MPSLKTDIVIGTGAKGMAMGPMADHFLAEVPDAGTYHVGIASRLEKICGSQTSLPSLALELFPAAPYNRTGLITLPPWNNCQLVYLFLKSEFHGYEGTLVIIIQEGEVDVLSVQLKRGDHEIKIVEGEIFCVRDNHGRELGPFDTISSTVAALETALSSERPSPTLI